MDTVRPVFVIIVVSLRIKLYPVTRRIPLFTQAGPKLTETRNIEQNFLKFICKNH